MINDSIDSSINQGNQGGLHILKLEKLNDIIQRSLTRLY
jgi:hypothetical protein